MKVDIILFMIEWYRFVEKYNVYFFCYYVYVYIVLSEFKILVRYIIYKYIEFLILFGFICLYCI